MVYNIYTMNKHQRGTVSELLAASYFVKNGYVVSKPLTDFNEYDFIIDDGVLHRVQVKTAYWDTNKKRHLVSCVTSHIRGDSNRYNKKYTQKSFDYLCAIEQETNSIYLIPVQRVVGRRSITLYPKGKPKTTNDRYEDFEDCRVQ